MKKSATSWALAPIFILCAEAHATPVISNQTLNIDENSASNTYIGKVTASNGNVTETVLLDVGTKDINNWSTRSESYESVAFNTAFSTTPIVFHQIQSYGNYNVNYTVDTYSYKGSKTLKGYEILFRTRQQNLTNNGFEAILETDLHTGYLSAVTSIDSVGGAENVGWLAFSGNVQGIWSDLPFEVTNTGEVVTDATTTVNFTGPFNSAPQLLTHLATSNGTDRSGVAVDSLSASKAKVKVDELNDGEHTNGEDISLLMLQGNGLLIDNTGTVFGETGKLEAEDGNRSSAITVSLANTYTNPVVFVQPVGVDGDIYDAAFRMTDVSNNSFAGYLHDDSESTVPSRHGTFSMQYFVFEAGSWQVGVENYSYAITAGNDSGAFQINSSTGEISVYDSTQLDHESGVTQYQLTVTATDGTGAVGTATVTIDINNVSDSLNSDAQPLYGMASGDLNGWATSHAGDVNGDGFDDVIVGTPKDDTKGSNAGRAYVLFGNATGSMADFASVVSGVGGFVINGESAGDQAGFAVAGGGDVNGDGLDDVVVGAPYADPNGSESGSAYVIFGKTTTTAVELSDIATDGNGAGFVMLGSYTRDHAGGSLILGDVNGDSLADIVISEMPRTSTSAGVSFSSSSNNDANMVYTVFGRTASSPVSLSAIAADDNDEGFVVDHSALKKMSNWKFGAQSLPVGDFNSDGLMDFIVNYGFARDSSGKSRLVYGRIEGSSVTYKNIASDGNGVDIKPESGSYSFAFSSSGGSWVNAQPNYTTSKVGDINGDGVDDIALLATDIGCCDGWVNPRAYIVFGTTSKEDIDLAQIALGNGGFIIHNDYSNVIFSDTASIFGTIAGAGDTNGDGYDDIIIGDQYAESNNGRMYIVYGKSGNSEVYLSDVVQGNGGFSTAGNGGDSLGHWASRAGDINGDGIADMMFGAPNADANTLNNSGTTYVMLGKGEAVGFWGSDSADIVSDDGSIADHIATGQGDDLISSIGGADVIYAGPGDDTIVVSHSEFLRIDGGNGTDTVKFDGADINLNLTAKSAMVRSVEVFDITGTGANVLAFNKSVSGNGQVIIKGDADDLVYSTNQQWTASGNTTTIDGVVYDIYTVGAAQLLLQSGLTISLNAAPTVNDHTFTIEEYTIGGTLVGSVEADSGDVGDSVTFSIVAGNEAGDFEIDQTTGALYVSHNVARVDFELANSYSLTVEVVDNFGVTAQGTTTVNVNNIDTISHTVSMDASGGGSIWGGWDTLAALLGDSITNGISMTYDIPNVNIDTEIMDLTAQGTIGVEATLQAEGGIVDATLPVTFTMSYPDEVEAGQTVAVNTSVTLDQGAGFTASSPYFELLAKGFLRDYDFSISSDIPPMISSQLSGYSGGISGTEDAYTFTIEASNDSVDGVISSNNDLRLEGSISLPSWVNQQETFPKYWADWNTALSKEKEGCFDGFFGPYGGEDLYYNMSYSMVESSVTVNSDLYQDFSVELTPVATLTLEDGTEFVFDPRDSLTFTPENSHDSNGDGIIDASMKVELNPVFTNDTVLNASVQMPFEVAGVSYNIQEALCTATTIYFYGQANATFFARDSVGPLVSETFNIDITKDGDTDLVQEVVSYALSNISYTEQLSFDLCDGTGEQCAAPTSTEPQNTPPVASNVSLSGVMRQGEQLSAHYSYSDVDNNIENGSTYQWYVATLADGSDGAAIANEISTAYTITTNDSGKYLQFCVTPSDGTDAGGQACSNWTQVATNSNTLTAGFGKAMKLNGVNQFVVVPLTGGIDSSNGSFTMETWVKIEAIPTGTQMIMQQMSHVGTGRTILGIKSNGSYYSYLGKANTTSNSQIQTGQWQHLAVVYDDSTSMLSLYVDGQLENQASRTLESRGGDIILGANRSYSGGFFEGLIEQTRVWNVALTQAQIKQRMNMSVAAGETGLLVQYTYDNDDGFTATDNNGSYDGTVNNSPSYQYSTERTLSFDGSGDYVEVADNSALEFGANNFSVEAWVYIHSNANTDYRNIVSKKQGMSSAAGWLLRLNKGSNGLQPSLFFADGSTAKSVTAGVITSNGWHHLAATFDRSNNVATLYVNGVASATNTVSNVSTVSSGVPLRFGTWSVDIAGNPDYWMGDLDEVRIWSDVRSASEIQSNMYERLSGGETGLVAYYSFEDGGAMDMTGNGHNGTLLGNTTPETKGITVKGNGSADISGVLPAGNGTVFVLDGLPTHGTVTIDAVSGEFSYSRDAASTATSDSFRYSVEDDNGNISFSETVYLTIE